MLAAAGVFIWRASVILRALERHAPGVYEPLKPLLSLGDEPLGSGASAWHEAEWLLGVYAAAEFEPIERRMHSR